MANTNGALSKTHAQSHDLKLKLSRVYRLYFTLVLSFPYHSTFTASVTCQLNMHLTSLVQRSVKLMAGVDVKASGIEKFDGTDFGYWKMQIEDYLYGKKLHLPLLGTKPDNITAAD
ncbi:hypothetical protein DKX38_007027 [Salix brachista]|uniref:Uncharacterized protein n=1 Tax=Salix brachista TaxID=2182728 RepID=A0A5N5MMF1_9ROSI|nr:hypothetical protein DKX38_007027 [Salix brachista]